MKSLVLMLLICALGCGKPEAKPTPARSTFTTFIALYDKNSNRIVECNPGPPVSGCRFYNDHTLDDLMEAEAEIREHGYRHLMASLKRTGAKTCEQLTPEGRTCYTVNGSGTPLCEAQRDDAAEYAAEWIDKNRADEKTAECCLKVKP